MQIIGIDVGYGYTKVAYGENGKITTFSFPSLVANFSDSLSIDGIRNPEAVEVHGKKYVVGEAAAKLKALKFQSRDKDWIASTAYAALVKYALKRISHSEKSLIVTGLPVRYYKSDKDKLVKIITDIASDRGITASVFVIPQPLGSYYDTILTHYGLLKSVDVTDKIVGILDIGYQTTDILCLNAMSPVPEMSSSFETGIANAFDAIARDIENKYSLHLDTHGVEKAAMTGKIRAFGKEHDISDIVKTHLTTLSDAIKSEVATLWGNTAEIDEILLTGGSAKLLSQYLPQFQQGSVINDCQLANAKGYYKYAARKINNI